MGFAFSSRISSAAKETGRSMVKILRTWSKSVLIRSDGTKCDCIGHQHTILQDIADNAKFIKVATATFCTKGFLESDLNVADVILVPSGVHGNISEPEYQDILDHLLPQVMINTESLVFFPMFLNGLEKFFSRRGVFSKWLLDDDAIDATPENITVLLEVFCHRNEDAGREGEIEKTVPFLGLICRFYFVEVPVKIIKGLAVFIAAGNVSRDGFKLFDRLCELGLFVGVFNIGRLALVKLFLIHLCPGIADDLDVTRKETLAIEAE